MSITRINHFRAAEGQAEALFEFLTSLKPYITNSEGCLSCQVLQSEDAEDQFVVLEQWQSKESHQLSITNFPKDDMQDAMILFAEPPKGVYYHE